MSAMLDQLDSPPRPPASFIERALSLVLDLRSHLMHSLRSVSIFSPRSRDERDHPPRRYSKPLHVPVLFSRQVISQMEVMRTHTLDESVRALTSGCVAAAGGLG